VAQHTLLGQDLLIIEKSRSHSDTPHSVGLLWTSDKPIPETYIWQNTTLTRDRQSCPPAGFEPTTLSSERAQIHGLDYVPNGIDKCQNNAEKLKKHSCKHVSQEGVTLKVVCVPDIKVFERSRDRTLRCLNPGARWDGVVTFRSGRLTPGEGVQGAHWIESGVGWTQDR
jgi:hypothetical protein